MQLRVEKSCPHCPPVGLSLAAELYLLDIVMARTSLLVGSVWPPVPSRLSGSGSRLVGHRAKPRNAAGLRELLGVGFEKLELQKHGGFHSHAVTPIAVYFMENLTKMHDFGVPPF